eukprot:Em0016g949a
MTRHWTDMKHELGRITAELEPRIHQVSDNLKQQLIEEGKAVEELMSKAGTKKCLQSLSLVQLEELWSSVAQHTPSRQRCLQVFEEALDKIECDRCSMVTEVISHYGDVLQAIAYLLPEEVTKLMEDIAHAINLSLIANKKSYAALVRHLMIVELMKERELHEQWEAIVCEWKEEVCSDVTSKFRSYMESDAVRDPPELQKVKALLKAEQTAVTRQREELLNQFRAGHIRSHTHIHVAVSNGQSQSISQLVQNLQVLVKQCDPVPGLERTEPSVLLAELPKVLDFFSTRVEYLCCKAHQRSRTGPDSEVPKGGTYSQSQGPISAVNITRSIMEAVTTKKRMDPEVELPPSHARHAKNSGSQTVLDTQPTAACKEGSGHKPESALHKSYRKQMAVERKNISFGSTGDEDGSDCRRFLPNIRAILVDVHTQLFQMAEVFYKQKGSRSVTRPDQLKETFELCMDHLTQRCQSYRTQAEEYRNDCIGELHEQLEQLMSTLEQVPLVVFSGVRRECQAKADKEWKAELDARLQKLEESSKAAASHVTSLCPAMGHPCQRQTLEQLCVAEQERHAKALETIKITPQR